MLDSGHCMHGTAYTLGRSSLMSHVSVSCVACSDGLTLRCVLHALWRSWCRLRAISALSVLYPFRLRRLSAASL